MIAESTKTFAIFPFLYEKIEIQHKHRTVLTTDEYFPFSFPFDLSENNFLKNHSCDAKLLTAGGIEPETLETESSSILTAAPVQ